MFKEENKYDISVLDSYLKINKLTKQQFCEICGISKNVLKKIYLNKTDIMVCDLVKISNEIKIPVASLFDCDNYSKIQTRFTL